MHEQTDQTPRSMNLSLSVLLFYLSLFLYLSRSFLLSLCLFLSFSLSLSFFLSCSFFLSLSFLPSADKHAMASCQRMVRLSSMDGEATCVQGDSQCNCDETSSYSHSTSGCRTGNGRNIKIARGQDAIHDSAHQTFTHFMPFLA